MFRDYKSGGYNMVGKSKEGFKIIISPLVKVPPLLRGARGDLYSLLPTPYSLLPTPYSLLPTPYSLLPTQSPKVYC
ncbi:MAG: hypothetical protein F6J98_07565 [Moorea sp. SIO4G2]|nr:hypothetical protein [Moorena sp. SIO4G2]